MKHREEQNVPHPEAVTGDEGGIRLCRPPDCLLVVGARVDDELSVDSYLERSESTTRGERADDVVEHPL